MSQTSVVKHDWLHSVSWFLPAYEMMLFNETRFGFEHFQVIIQVHLTGM